MTRIVGLVAATLLFSAQAAGAASWAMFSLTAEQQDTQKLVAATDKLMSSRIGTEFPGRVHLQTNIANGADPATHMFVPIYKTTAEREAFVTKMQADPAWTAFQTALNELSEPVSQVLYETVKNWGDVVDTDKVWIAYSFQVRDPAAFMKALDGLMATPTGTSFPGQVYLSEVIAGGVSPVTHVISVGYASEAEMAAWRTTRDASPDWATYLEASRKVADYLGGSLARDVKTWGASLADVTK